MKSKLFLIALLGQLFFSYGQYEITPSAVTGGINVNLKFEAGGFTYVSLRDYEYIISEQNIDIYTCYDFTNCLFCPIYQVSDNFFIPIENGGFYIINIFISTGPAYDNDPEGCLNPWFIGTTNILSTTIFENAKNNTVFYPNPTKGIVSFSNEGLEINTIQIIDNSGRLVKDFYTVTDNNIDLTELNNGMYFIKLNTENGNLTRKIILKK